RTCGLRIRSPTLYPTERRAPQQLAEREGFEPSIQLWDVYWFSKPAPSASRPPLPNQGLHLRRGFVDQRRPVCQAIQAAERLRLCSGRAGTPATVWPGATSWMTTALAPTL